MHVGSWEVLLRVLGVRERETFASVCGCDYLLAFLDLEVMLFLEASASYSGCSPVCFWSCLVWSSGAGVSEREKIVSMFEFCYDDMERIGNYGCVPWC